MDGVSIGQGSIIAAGSLVTMNKTFPARSLISGSPAKRTRDVTDAELRRMREMAEKYVVVSRDHLEI